LGGILQKNFSEASASGLKLFVCQVFEQKNRKTFALGDSLIII
jgi:hypothetical protein